MAQQTMLYDGVKATPISRLPAEAWQIYSGGATDSDVEKYYAAVAFFNRCIDIRANALVTVPWAIYGSGDDPLWMSGSPLIPAGLEWATMLPDLLWLTEAALTLTATAYWSNAENRMGTKRDLGWYAPSTMRPLWDKREGLVGFERRIENDKMTLAPEEVVYFCLPNGLHETEPRPAPAEAAMRAAGVIYNVDSFAEKFFQRGAIKTTLLTVTGNPILSERQRLKNLWGRITAGIDRAFGTEVVNAEGVKPVVIGEGISELTDVKLTAEKREDIATALGVPHSLVLSNASNFAVSQQDELNFYNQTVIPQTELITRQLNRQLLQPMGLRLQFMPDQMTIFQNDEQERSLSVRHLVNAGMTLDLAMEILGYDLTDAQWERVRETSVATNLAPLAIAQDIEREAEIRRFRKWAKGKRLPDPARFESVILSDDEKSAILEDGIAEDSPFLSRLRTLAS